MNEKIGNDHNIGKETTTIEQEKKRNKKLRSNTKHKCRKANESRKQRRNTTRQSCGIE
jgi:hypothetical protein